jgi:prepilin-type N-terminal cleavage/methylation domain-containing protein
MDYKLKQNKQGFTLIEIIIAMAILSIIAVGMLGNFLTSPQKARDAKRKAALNHMNNALETYYNDFGVYPENNANGQLEVDGNAIGWGDTFADPSGNTVYMKRLPQDPMPDQNYYYQSMSQQGYRIYAKLENEQDKCFDENVECYWDGFSGTSCGGTDDCNYVVVSSNEGIPSPGP